MKGFGKKSLVSIVAAGLLATSGFATVTQFDGTAASDFRINVDKSKVVKGKDAFITIELLKDDGTLDTIESLYGNTVEAQCVSDLGAKIRFQDFGPGVIGGKLDTTNAVFGEDTITCSVTIYDPELESKILSPKSFTIQIVPAANEAKGLEILQVQSVVDNEECKYDGNYSKSCAYDAGEGIVVKVQAISSADSMNDDTDTAVQNSSLTLRVIQDRKVVKTYTAQMEDGIAFVAIPNDDLTRSGTYQIQALTPTDQPADSDGVYYIDGKPTAVSGEYNLTLDPLAPAKVSLSANVYDIYRLEDDNQTEANVSVLLVDKYGNPANTDKVTDDVTVSLSLNDEDAFSLSNTTVTVTKNANLVPNAAVVSIKDRTKLSDTQAKVATVTATADNLDSGELNVNAYKYAIMAGDALSDVALAGIDNTDAILGTDFTAETNETKAGVAFRPMLTTDAPLTVTIVKDGSGTVEQALAGKPIEVTFKNADGTSVKVSTNVEQSDTAGDERNESFAVKLTEAKNLNYTSMIIAYTGSDIAAAPATVESDIKVVPNDPNKIEVYEMPHEGKWIDVTQKTPVESVTIDKNAAVDNGLIYFDSNETNVTTDTTRAHYLVYLEDVYGNPIHEGTISLTSTILDTKTLDLAGEVVDFNYSDRTEESDTIQLTAALVDPKNVDITITDSTPKLTKAQANISTTKILKGGYVPITVEAIDQNDEVMKDVNLTMIISDGTKVQVYDANLNPVASGSEVVADGVTTYFVKGVNLGDVTLTFRNTAGTIKEDVQLTVVETVEEAQSNNEVSGSVTLVAGKWNLITTPVPANMPKAQLDAYTSMTVWAFDSAAYNYTAAGDEIEVGKGYWVKADKQGGTLTYSAVPTVESKDAQWTLIQNNLLPGTWNLVGTSFDTTKTEVRSALGVTSVWPFDATAYQYSTAENISAGQGFWVK